MKLFSCLLLLGIHSGCTFGFSIGSQRNKVISNGLSITIPPYRSEHQLRRMGPICSMSMKDGSNPEKFETNGNPNCERRALLRNLFLSSSAILPFIGNPEMAGAKTDPLFAPNPLTNPVLEKVSHMLR